MKERLAVQYNGICYQYITEYIIWHDTRGNRKTSLALLDKNNNSITRVPANRVQLVEKE